MNHQKINDLYEFGPFKLNRARRRLMRGDETIPLPRIALDLLALLVEDAGHLMARETLIEALWPTTIVEENSLSWYVSVLRKTLGDEGKMPRYIETVRGRGYRFIAPVINEAEIRASSPLSPALRRKRTRLAAGAVLAVALIAAGFFLWYGFFHRPAAGSAAAAPTRSIAVLPFENLSANPANAYFAAGIQDTILTKLSGIADLHVISRTSTERYPSHPHDLRRIARELGVASVLEGSVQKSGNQVLINVQLIDAATDNHIWAQAYTRTLDNVFAVESDVAEQVAAALKAKLLPAEKKRVAASPTRNPQAYDLFLRAEYLASHIERGSANASQSKARRAANLYREAIARDPTFALARARLSYLESYLYWFGLYRFDAESGSQHLTEAQEEAQKALASGIPQAHLAMGYVYYWGYRDYAKALKQFQRALDALPNNAEVIGSIALIRRRQGQWQAALSGLQRSASLDPRNPRWYYELGATLAAMRDYPEAREQFGHALGIDPKNHRASAYQALVWLLSGKPDKARQSLHGAIPQEADLRGFVAVLRFEAARLSRDPRRALNILSGISTPWVEAAFATGNVPTAELKAQAWRLKGDTAKARRNDEQARSILQKALRKNPDDTNLSSDLGLVEANLGNGAKAIRTACYAVEKLPVSEDALTGPSHLVKLAATYARLGKSKAAIKLLDRVLSIPAGLFISVPLLKLDPMWDPLRHDPAFQALLNKHEKGRHPAANTQSGASSLPHHQPAPPVKNLAGASLLAIT